MRGYSGSALRAVAGLLLAVALAPPVFAGIDVDPEPPMRWDEMLACRLVVAARYERHDGRTLTLRVEKVLRGESVAEGGLLDVALEHRYSVETEQSEGGSPKLCYAVQNTPSAPQPVPVVADVAAPVVYFFPSETAPALIRRNQVQPPDLAEGWGRALRDERLDTTFRLLQDVNRDVRSDALDELFASRDRATIDALVAFLDGPEPSKSEVAASVLGRLGDREGDVYDAVAKRLRESRSSDPVNGAYASAVVLAQADPERAFRDFSAMIAAGPEPLGRVAAASLGYTGSERALDLAFDLLGDPTYADAAQTSLYFLVFPNERYGGPSLMRRAQALSVRLAAKARLARTSPDALGSVAGYFGPNGLFRDLAELPVTVDAGRARAVLLDPKRPVYAGGGDDEARRIYWEITRAADARYIPLLVATLRTVPAARNMGGGELAEALARYAAVRPKALLAEIDRQGLGEDVRRPSSDQRGQTANLAVWLGIVGTKDHLLALEYEELKSYRAAVGPISRDVVAALRDDVERDLADGGTPPVAALTALMRWAPGRGRDLLAGALEHRAKYRLDERCSLLALGVANGRKDLVAELKAAVRDAKSGGETSRYWSSLALALLEAKDDAALREYLDLLDAERRDSGRFGPDSLSGHHSTLLEALFPEHPREFFDSVTALAASRSLAERRAARRALSEAFGTDFDLDPEAPAAPGADRLGEVRPLFAELRGLDERRIRARVLRYLGVDVPADPGPDSIPALLAAGASLDFAVARNALRLLEIVARAPGLTQLERLPPDDRARALRAFAEDRKLTANLTTRRE